MSIKTETLGGISCVEVGLVSSEKHRCSFCTGKNGAGLGFFEGKEHAQNGEFFLLLCWNCRLELKEYLQKMND